jgi:hypothetical protein
VDGAGPLPIVVDGPTTVHRSTDQASQASIFFPFVLPESNNWLDKLATANARQQRLSINHHILYKMIISLFPSLEPTNRFLAHRLAHHYASRSCWLEQWELPMLDIWALGTAHVLQPFVCIYESCIFHCGSPMEWTRHSNEVHHQEHPSFDLTPGTSSLCSQDQSSKSSNDGKAPPLKRCKFCGIETLHLGNFDKHYAAHLLSVGQEFLKGSWKSNHGDSQLSPEVALENSAGIAELEGMPSSCILAVRDWGFSVLPGQPLESVTQRPNRTGDDAKSVSNSERCLVRNRSDDKDVEGLNVDGADDSRGEARGDQAHSSKKFNWKCPEEGCGKLFAKAECLYVTTLRRSPYL